MVDWVTKELAAGLSQMLSAIREVWILMMMKVLARQE